MASYLVLLVPMFASVALAQQIGTHVAEQHPEMPFWTCTSSGCSKETKPIVLDSNWRWIHNGQYTNCYKDNEWNKELCPDPVSCSKNCHLDGVSSEGYKDTYGINAIPRGLKLDFVKEGKYGTNYGSRVYLMEDEDTYKIFKMKNKELTLTVDMKRMPCGLNAAVYFVEMDADGGKARSDGLNTAGAKYGTGYCDAQCPHDLKFMNGEANSMDWNSTSDPPVGKYGICCAEMDIWEANSRATAYTPHPCSIEGIQKCSGIECGDNDAGQRYDGVCDKDGCDFNSYRMGDPWFYGRRRNYTLDSTKKMTVVTQFITHDGTDDGDLVDIKRFYVQDGKVVPNSMSSIAGVTDSNSVTDAFCNEVKTAFGDINDFKRKGGLKKMGDALQRGMVLVFSLWDDPIANMLWLDSKFPLDKPAGTPGVARGPCRVDTGKPKYVRRKYPTASAKFTNVKVGPINSTFASGSEDEGDAGSDDPFGDDRRLDESSDDINV
eukprot:TRINITY_DN19896_c0_g1_i1.p1 TRINITY_DN19896_c0_g1~~TRINITY_DN19896_c0_g1_i1.p1  ORF type:complete len:490 (+),score=106.30 TRINITY_DN19896_c0_g1_i1:115-1584(+)